MSPFWEEWSISLLFLECDVAPFSNETFFYLSAIKSIWFSSFIAISCRRSLKKVFFSCLITTGKGEPRSMPCPGSSVGRAVDAQIQTLEWHEICRGVGSNPPTCSSFGKILCLFSISSSGQPGRTRCPAEGAEVGRRKRAKCQKKDKNPSEGCRWKTAVERTTGEGILSLISRKSP